MDFYSLVQVIHSPTRYSAGHSAAFDLAFIPMSTASSYMILPPVSNSDHQSIFISAFPKSSSHPTSAPPSAKTIHLYSKANYEAINRSLESIDRSSFFTSDPTPSCQAFHDTIKNLFYAHIPSKSVAPSSLPTYTLPCLTPQIKKKIRHHRDLFCKAKKSNSPSIRSAYKHFRNEISHNLSISKASFMHSLSTSNSRRFWSYIKSTRISAASIPPLASSDNTLSPSDQDKANIFSKAFCSFSIIRYHLQMLLYHFTMTSFLLSFHVLQLKSLN